MDPITAAFPLVLPGLRPPTLLDSHSHLLPWLSADALASRFTQKASLRAPPARASASPGWLSWVALSITLPVRKAHPTPSLASPGSAVLGTCTSSFGPVSVLSVLTHSADGSSPSVCVRAFAELELWAQPSGLFPLLGHLGLPRALLYMGTQGLAI